MSRKSSLVTTKKDAIADNTGRLLFDLEFPDGTPVSASSISTAILNVRDAKTDAAIGTANRNVLSSFDAGGSFSYPLTVADATIITSDSVAYEDHIATLAVSFVAGAESHEFLRQFRVRVLAHEYATS